MKILIYIEFFYSSIYMNIIIHCCALIFDFQIVSISFFFYLFEMQIGSNSVLCSEGLFITCGK